MSGKHARPLPLSDLWLPCPFCNLAPFYSKRWGSEWGNAHLIHLPEMLFLLTVLQIACFPWCCLNKILKSWWPHIFRHLQKKYHGTLNLMPVHMVWINRFKRFHSQPHACLVAGLWTFGFQICGVFVWEMIKVYRQQNSGKRIIICQRIQEISKIKIQLFGQRGQRGKPVKC